MKIATRDMLAKVAHEKALLPFHGFLSEIESNIQPILSLFPKWNIVDADRKWCAAFVLLLYRNGFSYSIQSG